MSHSGIRASVFVFLACCGCFFIASLAHAQFRGGIHGTVQDPQGAVVAGVTLTLTDQETGLAKQTQTDSAGTYAFVALAPGHYSVVVEGTGFKRRSSRMWR